MAGLPLNEIATQFGFSHYGSVSGSIAKFDRQIKEDTHLAELMCKIDNIINEQTWPFSEQTWPFSHFLVLRQFSKYHTKVLAQYSEYFLLSHLRDKHHMIFTIPSRMREALVLFHLWISSFFGQDSEIHSDRRIGQTLVSPPAEPGVYLSELKVHRTVDQAFFLK